MIEMDRLEEIALRLENMTASRPACRQGAKHGDAVVVAMISETCPSYLDSFEQAMAG